MRSKVPSAPEFALQYRELERRWKALRLRGVSVREVACVGAPRTLLLAEAGAAGLPCVALSAGVHGDEPAGPWALLSLAESGLLDPRLSYRMWACTNPTGLAAGTRANADGMDVNRSFDRGGRTPEARAVITANRDRRFALSLDLHEDVEADGFYCYEPPQDRDLGVAILRALDEAGLPLQHLTPDFDLGYPEDAHEVRTLERGRVIPNVDLERRHFPGLPYSLYIGKKAAQHVMTLESPGARDWQTRIATLRVAVTAAIAEFIKVTRPNEAK